MWRCSCWLTISLRGDLVYDVYCPLKGELKHAEPSTAQFLSVWLTQLLLRLELSMSVGRVNSGLTAGALSCCRLALVRLQCVQRT